jgi:hypothetical protein
MSTMQVQLFLFACFRYMSNVERFLGRGVRVSGGGGGGGDRRARVHGRAEGGAGEERGEGPGRDW